MASVMASSSTAGGEVLPGSDPDAEDLEQALPGVELHPHARALLSPALAPGGRPSHAYLFYGPAGTGKRTVARAFAASLLAAGAPDPQAARQRVRRGTHPDLTWVTPSGAAEMLVSDVDEPVVAAAARTPFESSRRVFVLEAAHTLNEQAANRLLKTLEEPPEFAHLLLLSERREDVLPTVASRCQHVRFDPLPAEAIARRLLDESSVDAERLTQAPSPERVRACARLALGDACEALELLGAQGAALRSGAEAFARAALAGGPTQPALRELLDLAAAAASRAGQEVGERLERSLELAPPRERRRLEREAQDVGRRAERRARARALERALRLVELWLRDLVCLAEGAGELIHNVDRATALEQDAARCPPAHARGCITLVQDTRLRLTLNVSEELALEALAYRLTVADDPA
jgi:DNA polymerase III subunit delta'